MTPATRVISWVGLRPLSGNSSIRFWSTTVLSVLDTVSTVVLSPLTVTDSVTLPTFRATSRRTSSLTRTTMLSTCTVWKPESSTFAV